MLSIMDKMKWHSTFSVGVPMLDDQHKRIIGMINKLIETSCDGDTLGIISETLSEMTQYVRTHFRDEERLMIEHDYPDYTVHKELHNECAEKVMVFCEAATVDVETVHDKLLVYLINWWKDHILQEDMKYKPFLTTK